MRTGRWIAGLSLLLLICGAAIWLARGDAARREVAPAPRPGALREARASAGANLAAPADPLAADHRARAVAATASLEVAVVDAAGTPVLGAELLVVVSDANAAEERAALLAHARTTSGGVRFPALPAGVLALVEVSAEHPWSPAHASLSEPLEGQRRAEVVLPFDGAIVAGRALRGDGGPLANDEVWPELAWIRAHGRMASPRPPVDTGADGRFAVRIGGGSASLFFPSGLPESPGEAAAGEHWKYELVLAGDPEIGELRSQPAPLPSPPWPELVEVGELVLSGLPVLVAGTVVDPDGDGVAGAQFWLGFAPGPRRDAATALRALAAIPRVPHERSGEDGSFSLEGDPVPELPRMVLRAVHPDYLDVEPVEFAPGSAGVVVRLARGGFLEGSLAGSRSELARSVRVSMRDLEPRETDRSRGFERGSAQDRYGLVRTNTRSHGLEAHPAVDGSFGFGPLQPGRYELRARLDTHAAPFLVVAGLEIRESEVNRDPRVQAIDPSLHTIELTVLDSALEPVADGYALFGARGELDQMAHVRSGAATLLARELPVDVLVRAPGLHEATLAGVSGDAEVVLTPGVRVELLLPVGTIVPPGWTLRAIFAEPRIDAITWGYDSPLSAAFDEAGVARMTAPRTGTLELALEGERRRGITSTLASIPLSEHGRFVEVRAEPGACLVEVLVDPVVLAEQLRD